jgi:ubiquinone/menaquinone biosynthesis C-methylase UbiE
MRGARNAFPYSEKEIAENHEIQAQRAGLYREFGIDQELLRASIVNEIDEGSGKVLEVGTGKGHLSIELAKSFVSIVSVDSDHDCQHIAGLNAAHYNVLEKIEFVVGDASSLAYPDAAFDAVVSAFTFHHLEYPFRVMREMIRLARSQIVISDFTDAGFDAIARIHDREGRIHARESGDFGIVGVFLRESGFNVRVVDEEFQVIYSARRKS